jgi:hypothetical protein
MARSIAAVAVALVATGGIATMIGIGTTLFRLRTIVETLDGEAEVVATLLTFVVSTAIAWVALMAGVLAASD